MSGSPARTIIECSELILTNNSENKDITIKTTLGKNLLVEGASQSHDKDFINIELNVPGATQVIPSFVLTVHQIVNIWNLSESTTNNQLQVDSDGFVEILKTGNYCISSSLYVHGFGSSNRWIGICIVDNDSDRTYVGANGALGNNTLFGTNDVFLSASCTIYLEQGFKVGVTVGQDSGSDITLGPATVDRPFSFSVVKH